MDVENDRNLTSWLLAMKTGCVSSHWFGIPQSGTVYVKMSNEQRQSSSGKKLTVPEKRWKKMYQIEVNLVAPPYRSYKCKIMKWIKCRFKLFPKSLHNWPRRKVNLAFLTFGTLILIKYSTILEKNARQGFYRLNNYQKFCYFKKK